MIKNTLRIKYGVIFLVPLLISILFVGFNNTNASDGELELNQSEVSVISGAQIWLILDIDGTLIEGDSRTESLDRANTIELWSFRFEVQTPVDAASGLSTGVRTYSPIVFTKLIDKSSPLLFKALATNQNIDEAIFRFYRPNPAGDGTTEQHYTITIYDGRVASFKTFTLSDFSTGTSMDMEEISFVFGHIKITYEPDGIEHDDNWGERA